MKGRRFLSILATAVILALLIMAIPVIPCYAITDDESVTLHPTSGDIGEEIEVDGEGFEEDDTVYFYFSSESASVGDELDVDVGNYEEVLVTDSDGDGDILDSFDVPEVIDDGDDDEDVEDGTYYVYAVYSGDDVIVTRDTFSVSAGGGTGDESINVSPSSGEIDDYVEIEGTDFDADETVIFYFSSESAGVGDEIDNDVSNYEAVESADADSTGDVSGYFYVPETLTDGDEDEDVESGPYYVYATYEGDDEIVAKDTYTVSVMELSISLTKGVVGTEVKITGSGFDDNKSITIKFGTSPVDISEGSEKTSSSGALTSYILVPEIAKGSYTITVTVGSDKATAKFTVEPKMTISPSSGSIGDTVKVTGTGFTKSTDVTITFGGDEVGTGETDSYGSFEATFEVPEVAPGTHEVKADTAKAEFTITTSVNISPVTSQASPGYVGDKVTISGTGFKSNSDITITYTSEPVVFHTTSEADGSFTYTLTVPPSEAGEHTITASDGTSSMSVTFVMESNPPATPPPLLPYMGGKASSETHFDWEDVTADVDGIVERSLPITYDLQVATDTNFTNKLVDKTGLTTSEYTLTEAEKLESTGKDAPYYWRERAVDAASNASEWTGAGEFTVGFSFGIPKLEGWVLYLLIGVGAILLFFIGLLIGRRVGGGGGGYY